MKNALLALSMLFATLPAAQAKVSGGLTLGSPELFGAYLSPWVGENVSLDGRLTLSTVDVGLTGHIPFAGAPGGEHDFLVMGSGGYVHNLVSNHWVVGHGPHFIGVLGYGYQSEWDLRLLLGVISYHGDAIGAPAWGSEFTAMAFLGRFF